MKTEEKKLIIRELNKIKKEVKKMLDEIRGKTRKSDWVLLEERVIQSEEV